MQREIVHRCVTLLLAAAIPTAAEAQQLPTWRLVEEWRVGGEADGPLALERVKDMRLLRDGNIVLLNTAEQKLVFLSSGGKLLRAVGGKGRGPQEFLDMSGVAVSPEGKLVVADFQNARFAEYTSKGDFIRTVPAARGLYSTAWDGFFDATGTLLDAMTVRGSGTGTRIVWVRRKASDLARADSMFLMPCAESEPPPGAAAIPVRTAQGRVLEMRKAFASPVKSTAIDAKGFEWAPRRFGSNELVKRTLGRCDAVAVARLAGDRAPISKQEIAQVESSIRDYVRQVQATEMPNVGELPKEHTWFMELHVDATNRLWVDRLTSKGHVFDVFDENGRALASLDASKTPVVVGMPRVIGADRMFAFVSDADGVIQLVSYRLVR